MTPSPSADGTYDVVVVGGGHAGTQVVTELVAAGFDGRIALVEAGARRPYERPPLSKGLLKGDVEEGQLDLRADAFWQNAGVELRTDQTVVLVDAGRGLVETSRGATLRFGRLVWAAGGSPRRLDLPGFTLAGVHQLASIDDALRLRAAIRAGGRFVLVGGGFIGLEVAAACAEAGVATHVLERADRLLERVTGPEVSDYFRRLHEGAGVEISLGADVVGFESGDGATVSAVALASGESVPADRVLVAVGLVPNVEPLRRAGASVTDGLDVDAAGATSLPRVFAAGDCARFPHARRGPTRLESINNAVEQAKVIAANILGGEPRAAYAPVPRFWSNQYATRFKSVGLVGRDDERLVRGDATSASFSVVYLHDGAVTALDCVNNTRDYVAGAKVLGARLATDLARDPARPLAEAVLPA
ncbi:NAD(P)/FAD-dependent oxidoreductase [Pseudofrankia inefficax]|uniref:FAD-dependent pyridine nucleotide-disulfide oxidoreductase n=1 Tax=Pseudofrankia inefficax (strain DSM 45817 / CECT 9037 / DDB 130130 / EuI1c) TaxID=298654 RepID=E3IU48_PSEI1|nr:FAD-dependent oxidoreductase [Pseudofrankia inefficax]ADP81241.1 FAD-dependent pyridine nucleotide-disulfide oxidoreductase [Pseudofrankia inefficax]